MNTQTAHAISATDVEEHTRDKGNCTGIISAAVQPSMPFMPQSQEVQVRVTSSEDQTLPLYLCLEDYHNGMKPIGNIPETLGRLLLRSEIIGWTDKDPKAGLILEYWRESTEDHMLVNPLGLGEGCWVIPADRMAECSECVTEHMKRFVELCEEALDLPQSKECEYSTPIQPEALLRFHL